jgi:hypothetical protein
MIHLTRLGSDKPQTMKKLSFSYFILLSALSILIYSCTKNNDVSASADPESGASLHLLQSKWVLSSLKAYPTRDFSGDASIGVNGNGSDYYNFSVDGNIYVYALGVHDTAAYKFLPNDSTLLVYGYNSKGVKESIPDTAVVIKITSDSLTWYHRNAAGDYARFSFVK